MLIRTKKFRETTTTFYNEVIKELYPDMTKSELTDILKSPWLNQREIMDSIDFSWIRHRYIGVFKPPLFRFKRYLRRYKNVESKRKEYLELEKYYNEHK